MSLGSVTAADLIARPDQFDCIIDARSPAEFAEDHLPGAQNWPVLNDQERIAVGTLYKQESALAARKLGAAMVARNIATHVEHWLQDKPRESLAGLGTILLGLVVFCLSEWRREKQPAVLSCQPAEC
jgi:tRNA 2-selenouridine synthase